MIPYETASSGDRALTELHKILERFGCQNFGTMIDSQKGITIVQFTWQSRAVSIEASWQGYAKLLTKAHPYKPYSRGRRKTLDDHNQKAMVQARISVCSVLRDWIKAQVTAVESGVMAFDAAFMPHIMLENGKRVIDCVQAKNLLPPPK